jgi:hypothetical protein
MNWYALDVESKLRQREHQQQADMWRQARAASQKNSQRPRRSHRFLVWLGGRLEDAGWRLQARYADHSLPPARSAIPAARGSSRFQPSAIVYLTGPTGGGMPSARPCQDEVLK